MTKIYISSTYSDLVEHRQQVYDVLRKMRYDVIAMEDYVATDKRPLDKCLADVAACDVYIGIFAWRYGYIPPGQERSITELEYRQAGQSGLERLIFLLDEDAPWPRSKMEKGVGGEKIEGLRAELATEHTVQFFRSSEELAGQVATSVAKWAQVQLDARIDELRARQVQAAKARHEMRERQRVVNVRPLDVAHFKDRLREIQVLCDHLADASVRLVSVVGRGGMGKTALACRVLADLERGIKPSEGSKPSEGWQVDGILYLSARSTGLGLERIYTDVGRMLGEPVASQLAARWAGDAPLAAKVEYLLETMRDGLYLILLDGLEDYLTGDGTIKEEGLHLFVWRCLTQPGGARLIATSREDVRLAAVALPGARTIPLLDGLPEDEAVALLRDLDPQGMLGLRDAPEDDLRRAARLMQGIPWALERLAGILHEDPTASLPRLLADEGLFGEQVVEQLVAEGYRRLGDDERLVMHALAVLDRPVDETAIAYLLHPWFPGLDVRASLRRLTSGYFVTASRVTSEYSLHPLDRNYAYHQIPEVTIRSRLIRSLKRAVWQVVATLVGFLHMLVSWSFRKGEFRISYERLLSAEIGEEYTRRNLELRAADFYVSIRKPESEWKTIDDLEPQLAEFEHRVRAGDYDSACRVLEPIDFDYLYLWGHYTRLVEMREKLLGRLTDPGLQATNLGRLGRAYLVLGQVKRAIKLYEGALAIARGMDDRQSESAWLGNLGFAYRLEGQVKQAIQLYEQALAIAREIDDRAKEGRHLSSLGSAYRSLGQVERAIELNEQALATAREIGDRWEEENYLGSLGRAYRDLGQIERAIELYEQALAIAREIGHRHGEEVRLERLGDAHRYLGQIKRAIQRYEEASAVAHKIGDRSGEILSLTRLGMALLASGKLSEAQQRCAEALALDVPQTSYQTVQALGIVLLHQRNPAAWETFADAAARCQAMLDKTAGLYEPRYALAAALVGQAVCNLRWAEEGQRAGLLAPALAEYQRALENCAAPGVVRDALRDLEMIRAAGIEGLEPVFELLEDYAGI